LRDHIVTGREEIGWHNNRSRREKRKRKKKRMRYQRHMKLG
jgi:hypothetical protein